MFLPTDYYKENPITEHHGSDCLTIIVMILLLFAIVLHGLLFDHIKKD